MFKNPREIKSYEHYMDHKALSSGNKIFRCDMQVAITIEIDTEAAFRSTLIQNLSDCLEKYMSSKNFGEGVKVLYIRLICLRPVPGFEAFQKERKSRYINKKTIKLLDGSTREIENVFSYDAKLSLEDYSQFVKSDEIIAFTVLKNHLLDSLSKLDALSKKDKHFDVDLFKDEFAKFCER